MVSEPPVQRARDLDQAVTLAILAGGEGSRMGMPKGLLSIHGEPILGYLLRQIAWPGPTMLVSAPGREHPPGWEKFSIEATDPEAQGPLRGILTALENLTTPLVVVLTVDMPGVRIAQVRWLMGQMIAQPQGLGFMCRRMNNSSDRVEPFPSIYRREAKAEIAQRLTNGKRSVRGLLESSNFVAVTAPPQWEPRVWVNLNRPEELDAYLKSTETAG